MKILDEAMQHPGSCRLALALTITLVVVGGVAAVPERSSLQAATVAVGSADSAPLAWWGLLWRIECRPADDPRPVLFVCGVVRGGPASRAGLTRGDLIEEIDGAPAPFVTPLGGLDWFASLVPGREHVFAVRRGSEIVTVRVAPVEMPHDRIEQWKVGREMAQRKASSPPASPRPGSDFTGDVVRD